MTLWIIKININSSDFILSENPDAEYRYKLEENRFTPYYNNLGNNNIFMGFTNDYVEALSEFTDKLQYNIGCVESRRRASKLKGVEYQELSSVDCIKDSRNDDFTGKLIIIKANELIPEYRTAEFQLILCSHGFGAIPNALGTSVFGNELFSGDSICYGRHQVAGVADPAKLPQWATQKLKEQDLEKTAQISKPQNRKSSILSKLDEAKTEAAKQKAASNTKKSKKKEMEV